eukprot:CAMPEP_0185724012 /NCGR_PEP_ID=MMETSP1171-20130828/633_1 /TAXON_ID=374046 /ORGANISM="Helicotheca tamensis, Strain CCMP826" /LENGTH=431 /DNA_ID=CAMNT_0028391783 /DNA_START=43 /DNA_END=1338 /DNA_ORIENTATION=-
MTAKKIIIAGAGPGGLLLAHRLVRRPGYEIHIIERRSDPQKDKNLDSQRTFPIALHPRGLNALPDNVKSKLSNLGVWCVGTCLHSEGKKPRVIPKDQPTLSVDRNQIALTLLETLYTVERAPNSTLSISFDSALQHVDLESNSIVVLNEIDKTENILTFDHLVAADGGKSKVRNELVRSNKIQCDQKEIPDDYRTIHLSRTTADGSTQMDGDKVHGWMFRKEDIKVIGAPIHDGLLSGAFIFPKGKDPFVDLKTAQDVMDYFENLSPESMAPLITPELAQGLLDRPTSTLLSVRCNTLHVDNQVLLLGDAAHAVSASAGQGCNSTLQDVQIFCDILDQYDDDWAKSLPAYTTERLPDAHAVSDLSDYCTPRTAWMKVEWILRTILRKALPSFIAKWMRPLPMELLLDTSLSYREVLKETQWWIDRVKNTLE